MARLIFCLGLDDSAAAIETISTPKNENAVIKMADKMPPIPCGIKPALLYKLATPLTFFAKGQIPEIAKIPIIMKPIMATTLTKENQNSNSPKLLVLKSWLSLRTQ